MRTELLRELLRAKMNMPAGRARREPIVSAAVEYAVQVIASAFVIAVNWNGKIAAHAAAASARGNIGGIVRRDGDVNVAAGRT